MVSVEINNNKFSINNNINLFQHFLFIVIIVGLFLLKYVNYYMFHSAAEAFSCIIAGGIFVITLNTYKVCKNNFFMLLGIGYMFILILDLFHTFSYGDLIIFQNEVYDMDTKFWLAARVIELITLLVSYTYLFKNDVKPNFYIIFFVYFCIVNFLIIDIAYFNTFVPTLRIEGMGLTKFKIVSEYVLVIGFCICIFISYRTRKIIDKNLFFLLEISLICKVISELLFTKYYDVTDSFNFWGHIFKAVSYYFTYMGIIVNGLQRPFDMINNNLNIADVIIKEKEKQRKYMEEIILQNEQCYDRLIDNSGNGIVIIREGKLVYANSTSITILGANDLFDLIGRDINEFICMYSEQLEIFEESKNNINFIEVKLKKLSKEIMDVDFSINNITYRGEKANLIILKDISFKKEIKSLKFDLIENEEELLKSNEYNRIMTEFFSNISHELKTPINVILSAIQLLLLKSSDESESKFEEKSTRLLKIMKQNSFRLVRLVNNLIDISKFDSGYINLNLHNQNIVSIVEDITLSVGDYIQSKGVKLIFDTDVEEKFMAVDDDKIERIMLNLLSNAVKFTNIGDEIIVNTEDKNSYIRITVKDTGVGIPNDKLKMIFDRFAQVDKTLTRNREGSGIGLSLVKTLTEMHGGNISVKSKLGEGSEFIIELPVKIVENNKDNSISEQYIESKVDKVLIEFSDIYSCD